MQILTQEQVDEISLRKIIKYVNQNKIEIENVPLKRKRFMYGRIKNLQRMKSIKRQ